MFHQTSFRVWTYSSVAILFSLFAWPASAQIMWVKQDVRHDVSPALRDLPVGVKKEGIVQEAEPLRRLPLPPGLKPASEPDSVLQASAGLAPVEFSLTAGLSFEGLGQNTPGFIITSAPPDTNGAVGLTQYVQWVNTSFAVFDKTTGAIVSGPTDGNALWTGFGGNCESHNDGDPIVKYDRIANRWILSQFAVTEQIFGPFLLCVAVSTTPDATGTYYRYAFQNPSFDDYPKMGVWPDAYYETFNLFSARNDFLGAQACAYDRSAMLNGTTATQVCFQQPNTAGNLGPTGGELPSDLDGPTPPPVGSPNFVMLFGTNSLEMFKFHADFVTPGNSTFTGPTTIPVAPFTPWCAGGTCTPQPGTSQRLDSLADRLMYRLAYRRFGDHESILATHSVQVNLNGGVRWYEIQDPNGTPFVAQQSTFSPDTDTRWMGSIAMDKAGGMALGYSISSSSTHPSIAVTGRTYTDAPNTMQAETLVIAGTGSQTDPNQALSRWGDYSAMQIDPVDDCTFWFTTEYMQTTGIFNWNTRIASFKFPNCGGPPPPGLRFVAATPCRIADTRNPNGPFGGPFLSGGTSRGFTIPSSACNIPVTAQAYSLNVTVVPRGQLGFLTMFPCGQTQPFVSTLNSIDGRIKAGAAIVPAGVAGAVCAFASNDTDMVLDINGYFVPAANPAALAFYPVTPCRLVDTRLADGPLGGPSLAGGAVRTFPLLSSSCNVPSTAQAYSLNYTSVPQGGLGFLTTWPAGQTQPLVSTLNAPTGAVTANAAIVPAGTSGAVSVFASNNSDLVIDINGYFAPFAAGGLSLYNLSPCRVLDTRNPPTSSAFTGAINVNVGDSVCGAPATTQSFVLNATVVPSGSLGFLTLWPQGATQPLVSTLNAPDGSVTSNLAIVPTTNGSIAAFGSGSTHLVLDISGYFAP